MKGDDIPQISPDVVAKVTVGGFAQPQSTTTILSGEEQVVVVLVATTV